MDANVRNTINEYFKSKPIQKAWVFGSVARGEEHPDSDVDILVKFSDSTTVNDRISFKFDISDMLSCRTDVVSVTQLLDNPRLARQVLKERIPV